MCQKATGGFFGPYVGGLNLRWTRGAPAKFQSSNKVKRGFCKDCGTPMTFEFGEFVELSIGAFDEPARITPVVQMRVESRMPWFAELAGLEAIPPAQTPWQEGIVSHQHPDHDTDAWTPISPPA